MKIKCDKPRSNLYNIVNGNKCVYIDKNLGHVFKISFVLRYKNFSKKEKTKQVFFLLFYSI